MAQSWTVPHLMRSRRFVAWLALALLMAGCSGPDADRFPTTVTSSTAVTATVATTEAPAASATDSMSIAPTTTGSLPASPTVTAPIAAATASSTVAPVAAVCNVGVELVAATDVLDKVTYDGDDVGGLSALAWDPESATYLSLSDRGGRAYELDFATADSPVITGAFRLRDTSGEPDVDIDGEGIAVLPTGDLLVSSELEPSIRRYTADGEYVADLPVPEHFLVEPAGRAVGNKTFESLTVAPSGNHAFTAVEEPLVGDGETDDDRGRIRILRYDATDETFEPGAEFFYLSEPEHDVSEIAAISDTELLVMERGLSLLEGFTTQIYRVSLDGAEDFAAIERLEDADAQPVTKELLVDVSDCPAGDREWTGEINPLTENFESMALGPLRDDGRQTLIIGSDDNHQSFQVTRFLVFAIDPDQL